MERGLESKVDNKEPKVSLDIFQVEENWYKTKAQWIGHLEKELLELGKASKRSKRSKRSKQESIQARSTSTPTRA